MDTNICAPHKYDSDNKTCFSTEQLLEMARAYNRYLTKTKLLPNKTTKNISSDLIKIKTDKPYLLHELLSRFETVCDSEVCLTKQSFMNEIVKEMRDEFENDTFRHEGPSDPTEWLNTTDIGKIVKQYEKIYPNFKFLGAVPLNCNDLSFCSLYKLDYNDYVKKNIKYLGMVFNHDRHGETGSHWVSLFIDIPKGEINYCDSTGKNPIANINDVIKQFISYHEKKTGKKAIYKYNTKPYQKDASECGVYSANFIIRRLAGENFDTTIKDSLDFREINSCRNVYFRNKPSKYTPPQNKC